jgi:hypothetical protein
MSPSLSVVATSRNDGHGGHLVERMQWFVDGLDFHARTSGARVELIMVEWNPPAGAPPLADVLRWPLDGGHLTARVVTVPNSIHRQFKGAERLPLFQMIAKNVGIRRAAAEHVLATNIDILLSTSLFERIVHGVERGALYRADRYDVDFPMDRAMTVPEALDYCARQPKRMMRPDGAYYPGLGRVVPNYRSGVDYVLFQAVRARRRLAGRDDVDLSARRSPPIAGATPVHCVAAWVGDRARAARDLRRLPKLHTNACGDFTLLSNDDWTALRGYPEWPMYSWNLDSVLLYQAAASGIREVDLPPSMPLFHIEHDKGSGWTPEGHGDLFGRLDRGGVGYLTVRGLRLEAVSLFERAGGGDTVPYNDASWGLAEHELPSQVCSR